MGQNKTVKGLVQRNGIWHIEKQISGQRIRKSTGTADKREAEKFLVFLLEQHRKTMIYGDRLQYTFEQAATRYIKEETKKSLPRDIQDLRQVMPFIGGLMLEQVHDGTLQRFVDKRRVDGVKSGTVNRALSVVGIVLKRANKRYRDVNGRPWLAHVPEITKQNWGDKRRAHILTDKEEYYLLAALSDDFSRIVGFLLNTGLRAGELCALRWDWLEAREHLSCFVFAGEKTKNQLDRLIALNSNALQILSQQRGLHEHYVFPGRSGQRKELKSTGWRRGRERAADAFERGEGKPASDSFRNLRLHDLRHTFATRLRRLGVSHETRKDLMDHAQGDVTTLYSQVEVFELWRSVELLCSKDLGADILQFPAKSPQGHHLKQGGLS